MNFEDAAIKILKLSNFWETRVFQVAVKLNIFTLISLGNQTVSEITQKTKTNERAMWLFLNALVGMKLLKKRNGGYKNSELAEGFLVLGKKNYFGYGVKLESLLYETFAKLEKTLKTGKPARKPDMFQSNQEELLNFIMSMHNFSWFTAHYLAKHLSTRGAKSLLDVGAGPGTYSYAFLKKNKNLKATFFDYPKTNQIAQGTIAKYGIAKRVKLVSGDYRKNKFPGKHDIVLISNIIHAEGPKEILKLFKKSHAALKPGGKLWLHDALVSENGTHPTHSSLFAIVMLLNTKEGRVYTWQEIKTWLDSAGFSKITRLKIKPPNGHTLMEAIK